MESCESPKNASSLNGLLIRITPLSIVHLRFYFSMPRCLTDVTIFSRQVIGHLNSDLAFSADEVLGSEHEF